MSVTSVPHRAGAPPGARDVRAGDPDRRFYAFAVDRLIAWGIDVTVAVVATRSLVSHGHPVVGSLVIMAVVPLVGLVFAVLLGTTGTTPGCSLLGLRLVHSVTGEPIGVGRAILRTFVLALATLPFGFGLAALAWTALVDATGLRRGWHDHLVSSILVDVRPVPVVEEGRDPGAGQVVNLTALRLAPSRRAQVPVARTPVRRPVRARPAVAVARSPVAWELAFDSGQRVVVDTLVLIGHRPEAGPGEQGALLVALPSADGSVARTHAQVVVAADGALVVTDRGSTLGSTLVRRGLPRPLTPGRPTTLLEGDSVTLGDRTLTVHRLPGLDGSSA
jgi:hypothetical protein